MEKFISDANTLTIKEFTNKYNHPFMVQIVEAPSPQQQEIEHKATVVAKVQDIIKLSSNIMEVINIYPVIKVKNKEDNKILIGRNASNDICINSVKISNSHAFFLHENENDYFLTDMNSTNGSYLNSSKLEPFLKYSVKNSDIISFADISFRFFSNNSTYFTLRIFSKHFQKD